VYFKHYVPKVDTFAFVKHYDLFFYETIFSTFAHALFNAAARNLEQYQRTIHRSCRPSQLVDGHEAQQGGNLVQRKIYRQVQSLCSK
jgi:hypothetical protein